MPNDYITLKARKTSLKNIRKERKALIIALVSILFIGIVGHIGIGMVYQTIIGESMMPTYSDGEMVKYSVDLESLERGNIVFFKNNRTNLVKRIIGLPGETISIKNDVVYINGESGIDIYGVGSTFPLENESGEKITEWTLGENEYFVLGDNREHSVDSRYFGAVSKTDVYAVAR